MSDHLIAEANRHAKALPVNPDRLALALALQTIDELERENATLRAALDQQANYQRELRADRDRLDWLARNRSVSIKERPLFVTPESLRAAIDAELKKEEQP
jgi:methionyl-tRNA formyltransferase